MIKGKAVVAQGGGPTAVINETLVGVITQAKRSSYIIDVYGSIHGVRGIENEDFVDLSMISDQQLQRIAETPASALLSTRDKPDFDYCKKIIDVFKAHDIRYFYYIGGNDSEDTCRILSEASVVIGYELYVVHIPKTIDNDLLVNDHTPGFGSAAQFVANAFAGIDMDIRALPGVYIGVVMGRDAGFLTAASALARQYEDSAPHLIYIPEVTFDTDMFLTQVKACYEKYGRCVIAVSEGIRNKEGTPVAATILDDVERDSHGNVQLSGTGALADSLVKLVKNNLSVLKVRGDTFGYLQRSYPANVSSVDADEARKLGEIAVLQSLRDDFESCSIAIIRVGNYSVEYRPTPLTSVAKKTKGMDPLYYNSDTAMVTEKFLEYLRPLVSEIPQCERLDAPAVTKILRK